MTIWLVRHGETEWSLSGQHSGSTDIPLTQQGRLQAGAIGKLLAGRRFDHVFSSPMGRAIETGTLAGFGERILVDERLCEFDYGEFEGRTTVEIWSTYPGWEIFRDGCPGGETPEQMSERADALLEKLRVLEGNTLLFGHGHCFRAIAARFLGLPIGSATSLQLEAGTISVVADGRDGPALLLWNRRVQPQAMVVADVASAIADAVP